MTLAGRRPVTPARGRGLPDESRDDPPDMEPIGGRYRLWWSLGSGGMGRVWLAEDLLLARVVAVKQVGPQVLPDAVRAAVHRRGLAEARAAARIRHPGVVSVYDVLVEGGRIWIVMELLAGATLAAAVGPGPLPEAQVVRVGLRLLEALAATHRAGVVHCDVKPANVFLCGDGRVVLTDFGIARADSRTGAGHTGRRITGSPGFISPEQISDGRLGPAADLFALGATLFTAVEGRSPFHRDTVSDTLAAVLTEPPWPFRYANRLRPVLAGLLVKDPDRRMSAQQARAGLRAVHRAYAARCHRGRGGGPAHPCGSSPPDDSPEFRRP